MPTSKPENLYELLLEIKDSTSTTSSRVSQMKDELTRMEKTTESATTKLEEVREEVIKIDSSVQSLSRDMWGGGIQPLPIRVALLEDQVRANRMDLEKTQAMRWQLWLAIITSFVGPVLVGAFMYWITRR